MRVFATLESNARQNRPKNMRIDEDDTCPITIELVNDNVRKPAHESCPESVVWNDGAMQSVDIRKQDPHATSSDPSFFLNGRIAVIHRTYSIRDSR